MNSEIENIVTILKEGNELLEEAGPKILPELERFLNNCQPLADVISKYLTGGEFAKQRRFHAAHAIALVLVEKNPGMKAQDIAYQADNIVRELEVFSNL